MNRLQVFSTPVEGQEAEYHAYYSEQHIPDIQRLPGVGAVRRFEAKLGFSRSDRVSYATEFEVDGDPAEVLALIAELMGTPQMPASDAVESSQSRAWLMTEHSEFSAT
jgi:hypothetical protein